MKRASLGLVVLLTAAAVFYALLWPRYPIGHYNDDALYILGAESLLQGEYVLLQRPDRPPFNEPPPGYSLFLAPFVALARPHWDWLKAVPWALTVLSGLLLWLLSRPWFSAAGRLLLAGLFLFNPCAVSASGSVMAESCLLAMALAAFIGLDRVLRGQGQAAQWWTGALLGWAALVRPQGLVLLPAAALALAHARRWRAMLPVLGTALSIWGAVLARNVWTGQSAAGYAHYWGAMLRLLGDDPSLLLRNFWEVLRTMVLESLLGLALPAADWPAAAAALTAAGAALVLAGALSWPRGKDRARDALALGAAAFAALYFLLHSVWMAKAPRYFLPILPIVLAMLLAGLRRLCGGRAGAWAALALAPMALGYAVQDVFAAREAMSPPAQNRLPWAALRWIEGKTPASADLLCARAPVVYLRARRHARSFLGAGSAEHLRYRLLKAGVTHVLCEPRLDLLVHSRDAADPVEVWERVCGWLKDRPQDFPVEFASAEEGAWLYRVPADPDYLRAYEFFEAALQDLDRADWPQGLAKLGRALALRPAFAAAHNARGSAYLLSGSSLAKAEAEFQEALRLRPDYPLALLNLARVSRRRARAALARGYLSRCRQAVARSGEGAYLMPAIEAEETSR